MAALRQTWSAERFPIYHATSRATWDLIQKSDSFRRSENKYDWLGTGTYFWQSSPVRAWIWKRYQQVPKSFRTSPLETVVLKYTLDWDPNECIDLLDVMWYAELEAQGTAVVQILRKLGVDASEVKKRIDQNSAVDRPTPHYLDCSTIDTLCRYIEENMPHLGEIKAVRGVFQHLSPVFEGSAFRLGDHVEIAIRTPSIINVSEIEVIEDLTELESRLSTRLFEV